MNIQLKWLLVTTINNSTSSTVRTGRPQFATPSSEAQLQGQVDATCRLFEACAEAWCPG